MDPFGAHASLRLLASRFNHRHNSDLKGFRECGPGVDQSAQVGAEQRRRVVTFAQTGVKQNHVVAEGLYVVQVTMRLESFWLWFESWPGSFNIIRSH
jgi:hypothetical protein